MWPRFGLSYSPAVDNAGGFGSLGQMAWVAEGRQIQLRRTFAFGLQLHMPLASHLSLRLWCRLRCERVANARSKGGQQQQQQGLTSQPAGWSAMSTRRHEPGAKGHGIEGDEMPDARCQCPKTWHVHKIFSFSCQHLFKMDTHTHTRAKGWHTQLCASDRFQLPHCKGQMPAALGW